MGKAVPTALALVLAASGCGVLSGPDPLRDSTLPTRETTPPAGPAYLSERLGTSISTWDVVVGGRTVSLGKLDRASWLPDGRVLVVRSRYQRSGKDLFATRPRARIVEPTTGEVVAEQRGDGDWGITPEAITLRNDGRNRITVYSPDLSDPRVITVGPRAVKTDQLDKDEATFHLHHAAYTLDGVTWVQWGINSEDDTRTDHGVLRIEGDEPTEVLRNEPIVALLPSSDGSALLALLQDNGEDESCGGCVVEQKIVELDPATGEVAADYRMPSDYDRSWRVEVVDKVGDTVVVRFSIGEAEEKGDPGVARQTWTYDGSWSRVGELDGTRTRWQDGGQLSWTQTETRRDVGEGARYRLTWRPDSGGEQVLSDGSDCPENDGTMAVPVGAKLCPLISAPGSLLPPE